MTRHEDVAACFRDPRLSAARTQLFYEHQLRGLVFRGFDSLPVRW
ncbi:hypothetical protein [Hyalangium sp.]|nr:hypothetical protein [Hyalangium sp.]HYH96015.1 hypothetical protein [Hyalangium sp.]